jgi:uncharacterized protein HemX
VIAWLGTLSLRLKLYGIAIAAVLGAIGYLWLRWKLASRKATTMQERAEKLEQTRALEQRIAQSRAKTRAQQEALRSQIRERGGERDYFER